MVVERPCQRRNGKAFGERTAPRPSATRPPRCGRVWRRGCAGSGPLADHSRSSSPDSSRQMDSGRRSARGDAAGSSSTRSTSSPNDPDGCSSASASCARSRAPRSRSPSRWPPTDEQSISTRSATVRTRHGSSPTRDSPLMRGRSPAAWASNCSVGESLKREGSSEPSRSRVCFRSPRSPISPGRSPAPCSSPELSTPLSSSRRRTRSKCLLDRPRTCSPRRLRSCRPVVPAEPQRPSRTGSGSAAGRGGDTRSAGSAPASQPLSLSASQPLSLSAR